MRPNIRDIGTISKTYLGYASDPKVRSGAASGGVVSQILIDMITNNTVDYAIVSRIESISGRLQAKLISTTDRDAILSARTSIYFDYNLLNQLLPLIDPTKRYGIVMLPCQAKAFNSLCVSRGWDRNNFVIIGLFCGHATDRELLDLYLMKMSVKQEEVQDFRFRVGHWRGKTLIRMNDGREHVFPTLRYNIYQNLFFFTKTRCLSCEDHFAKYADISCGDAWIRALKSELVKHSLLISRNERAEEILQSQSGTTLKLTETDSSSLLSSQKRSVIYHSYNINGRAVLAPLFGIRITSTNQQKPKWNDLLGAFFILSNYWLSRSSRGKKFIMKTPYLILYAYAMFLKLFINF